METTLTYKQALTGTDTKEKKTQAGFWEKVEYNRFGITIMLLMAVLIPAGMSAAFALNMGSWQFASILGLAMLTLTMVLGMAPMRIIFASGAITLLVSIAIMVAGLIQTGGLFANFH